MDKQEKIVGGAILGAILIAGVATFSTCSHKKNEAFEHLPSRTQSAELLENRLWITHLPATTTDLMSLTAFVKRGRESVGVTIDKSEWRNHTDVFVWKQDKAGEVKVFFPQDDLGDTIYYRAWECDDHGFEYCLEITSLKDEGFFKKNYYSVSGLEIDASDINNAQELVYKMNGYEKPTS